MKPRSTKGIILLTYTILFTWIARFVWDSPWWEVLENICINLLALLLAYRIISDARKSSAQRKSCSKLIDQISFVIKPNLTNEHPYRRTEIVGWLLGGIVLALVGTDLITAFGS